MSDVAWRLSRMVFRIDRTVDQGSPKLPCREQHRSGIWYQEPNQLYVSASRLYATSSERS